MCGVGYQESVPQAGILPCPGAHGLRFPSCAHHDSIMDESTPVPGRSQVWVFLCARYLDAPNRFPRLIELCVDRINPRMMWSYSIAQVCGNPMLLKAEYATWSFNIELSLLGVILSNSLQVGAKGQSSKKSLWIRKHETLLVLLALYIYRNRKGDSISTRTFSTWNSCCKNSLVACTCDKSDSFKASGQAPWLLKTN